MEPKRTLVLCLTVLGLINLPILASSQETYVYAPEPGKQIYFGHISFSEISEDAYDAVVFRKGENTPEKAVLNFPLGPGDIIQTSTRRRCEIQFDTGTIIRLDLETRLRIETILAQSLSSDSKISNVVLEKGRIYAMYKRYNRPEIFQVVTDNAALKLEHNAVCVVQAGEKSPTDIWVDQGKVRILYGAHAKKTAVHTLKMSRQIRVNIENVLVPLEEIQEIRFSRWNRDMNENFLSLHANRSKLPKPIQRYPAAVMYFAQKYSLTYGEWLYHDFLGYVWNPHISNYYPQTPWRPMVFGQWRELAGQLFWVPEEPWGWAPYHLGIWFWDKNKGWLWIPGRAYAPAWAQWHFFFSGAMFAWNPLSLYSWCPPHLLYAAAEHEDDPYEFVYRSNPLLLNPNPPARIPENSGFPKISKTKPSPAEQGRSTPLPVYSLPDSLKNTIKNVRNALENKDPVLLESIRSTPFSLNRVHKPMLGMRHINEKLIESGSIPSFGKAGDKSYLQGGDAARAALNVYRSNRIQRQIPNPRDAEAQKSGRARASLDSLQPAWLDSWEFRGSRSFESPRVGLRNSSAGIRTSIGSVISIQPQTDPVRFRDWNPDVRNFTRNGVAVHYDSRENRIRIPQFEDTNGQLAPGSGRSEAGMRIKLNSRYVRSVSSGSDSGNSSSSSLAAASSGKGGSRKPSGSTKSASSRGSSTTTKKK